MALSNAWFGFGTILQVSDGQVSPTFTNVAEITNLTLNMNADPIDITNHDSTDRWRDYLQGLKGLEFSLEGNWLPTSVAHNMNASVGMLYLYDGGIKRVYRITFPTSPTVQWEFTGIFTNLTFNTPHDDKLSFNATLMCCSEPTLS